MNLLSSGMGKADQTHHSQGDDAIMKSQQIPSNSLAETRKDTENFTETEPNFSFSQDYGEVQSFDTPKKIVIDRDYLKVTAKLIKDKLKPH